jgi:hypothetical protein
MGNPGRSFLYGFRRDAWNRRFQKGRRQGEQGVGALVEAIPTADGGRFRFEHATLEVRFLAKDLVRRPGSPALPVPYAIAGRTGNRGDLLERVPDRPGWPPGTWRSW